MNVGVQISGAAFLCCSDLFTVFFNKSLSCSVKTFFTWLRFIVLRWLLWLSFGPIAFYYWTLLGSDSIICYIFSTSLSVCSAFFFMYSYFFLMLLITNSIIALVFCDFQSFAFFYRVGCCHAFSLRLWLCNLLLRYHFLWFLF